MISNNLSPSYFVIMKIDYKKLTISLVVSHLAGIIGGYFTMDSVATWYQMINRPTFTPPDWIFGPVWFLLYTLMGIALYRIWQLRWFKKKRAKFAMTLFSVQLFFNALWSAVFFGLQNPTYALVIISILFGLVIWNMSLFWSLDKKAGYLLLPYVLWLSYALVLNAGIALLN